MISGDVLRKTCARAQGGPTTREKFGTPPSGKREKMILNDNIHNGSAVAGISAAWVHTFIFRFGVLKGGWEKFDKLFSEWSCSSENGIGPMLMHNVCKLEDLKPKAEQICLVFCPRALPVHPLQFLWLSLVCSEQESPLSLPR